MIRLLLSACLILCLAAPSAYALQKKTLCQCMEAPLRKRWLDTKAVFTGTVTEIEPFKEWIQRGSDDIPIIVTLRVHETFKGGMEKGSLVKLHTNLHKHTCMGADYALEKEFLIFAYIRKEETYEYWSLYDFPTGTLDVGGYCGGTKTLGEAADADIAELRKMTDDGPKLEANKEGVYGYPPEKPPSAH